MSAVTPGTGPDEAEIERLAWVAEQAFWEQGGDVTSETWACLVRAVLAAQTAAPVDDSVSVPPRCPRCGSGAPNCRDIDPATGQQYRCEDVCGGPWADDVCAACAAAMDGEERS